MDALKLKRKNIKTSLTTFENFFRKHKDDPLKLSEIKLRFEKARRLLDEFSNNQDRVELAVDVNYDQEAKTREEFENAYYSIVAEINDFLKPLLPHNGRNPNDQPIPEHNLVNERNSSVSVRLPPIHLPSFDGSFDMWQEFHDTFRALVHDNETINAISKFQYLRGSLTGEAATVIKSITGSAANYQVAWDLLVERYKNDAIIINKHIATLVELPAVKEECYSGLRALIDNTGKHLRSLEALGEPVNNWGSLLTYLILKKVDNSTRRAWEERTVGLKSKITIVELTTFLKERCSILEAVNQRNVPKRSSASHASTQSSSNTNNTGINCSFCKKPNHYMYKCRSFQDLTVPQRIQAVRDMRVCFNCFDKHRTIDCKRGNCRQCSQRHHTLLHLASPQASGKLGQPTARERDVDSIPRTSTLAFSVGDTATREAGFSPTTTSTHFNTSTRDTAVNASEMPVASLNSNSNGYEKSSQVLLSTAVVFALNIQGEPVPCRVLLDSGSMPNIVSEALVDRLGLFKTDNTITIKGVNGTITNISFSSDIIIKSLQSTYSTKLKCLVVPTVTGHLPSQSFSKYALQLPDFVKLADPRYNVSDEVDLLVGADCFYDLLLQQQHCLGTGLPTLQNTKLGWVLAGRVPMASQLPIVRNNHCLLSDTSLSKQLQSFWEIENCAYPPVISQVDQICEDHFKNTFQRATDGRFVVSIPFTDTTELGDSRPQALRRFYKLEDKLVKDKVLQRDYIKFMRDYLQLGHMKELTCETKDTVSYYFAHHPVVNPFSTTTKLRVVFDGSGKTTTGVSLNDVQLIGPKLQSDIVSLLIRFRTHKYVFSADISKMYRQIWVQPNQRSLQRVLWREDPSQLLKCYELQTVSYGTSSAPYLAIRCLKQLAMEFQNEFPLESTIIDRDFYVDDLLSGCNSITEANSLRNNITNILNSAGLSLCKWASNYDIEQQLDSPSKNIQVGQDETRKTLGIWWNTSADSFHYKISQSPAASHVTKRSILSSIAKLYDPLGLLSPVIIVSKMLMQELWQGKYSWDESVPHHIFQKWSSFIMELPELEQLKLPRYFATVKPCTVDLHSFCDASESAYGACVYIRTHYPVGTITVSLVAAKCKVSPLKKLTIPRLELEGAVLLSQLYKHVVESLNLTINRSYFWTDSTIVLSWIRSAPNTLKTFVSNRVSQIQDRSDPSQWFHVPSAQNPADLISRGISSSKLTTCKLWWSGPDFLSLPEDHWQHKLTFPAEPTLVEMKSFHAIPQDFEIFSKFSTLSKLIRVTAYCFRFYTNLKIDHTSRKFHSLTVSELTSARMQLIKLVQATHFSTEIAALHKGTHIQKTSPIIRLNPFIDSKGVIRVGGRLNNSIFSYEKKHPILLPKGHRFTQLVFKDYHVRYLHCSPQALLAAIREVYWPISGRLNARATVSKCLTCFKASVPKNQTMPLMAALPKNRVTPASPFSICGVDYAGPFMLQDKKSRGCKKIKCYICLFVCFGTKAIHLELVSDLTSECFLAAFYRFTARRGRVQEIYSDNGTCFVGAAAELGRFLKSLNKQDIMENNLGDKGITFRFIPPNSPHFGGLWEAGVKSAKGHLRRVLGDASLVYEEFYTVLTQIEAVLNSRPLSPLSSDPSDYTSLTPAHFLIGRPLLEVPSPDYTDVKENQLSRYQRVQQLQQHFWARWSKEYIGELQHRAKWFTSGENQLQPGAMVLVRDDNLPPRQWRLGRVVAVQPGKDNVVRVATVRTAKGDIKRAVRRLCVLPMEVPPV